MGAITQDAYETARSVVVAHGFRAEVPWQNMTMPQKMTFTLAAARALSGPVGASNDPAAALAMVTFENRVRELARMN